MSAIDDVLKYIATNEIRWVDLQFFDLRGRIHRVTVSNRKIEEASFSNGIHAADLTEVFGPSEQGELLLLPDPDTLSRLPWEPATVRLICDVLAGTKRERFLKDPRYVAERIETNLTAAGIKHCLVGSEVDCHIFDSATSDKTTRSRGTGILMDSREAKWNPSPASNDSNGAFVATPNDILYTARTQVCETMEDSFGMLVDAHRHGRAPTAQQTFELAERSLKSAADAANTIKFVTKNLALAVGAASTFMPYPMEGEKGNGLRMAASLWKTSDNNLFYDGREEYGQLSQTGRYYIGGILEHAAALCLFAAPTPNSYHRFAVDPKKVGWSAVKGDCLVTVPASKRNVKEAKRIVYNGADPSANPYLAYAAVVAAGLDGIKNKIDPGDPVENDSKKVRVQKDLPESLLAACNAVQSDVKFLKGVVPVELLGDFIALKERQHREAMQGVSAFELQTYWNV